MRNPINPVPGMGPQLVPIAVSVKVDVYESQPGTPGAGGSVPRGVLAPVRGTFTDDASRVVQKTMTLDVAEQPDFCQPGMWVLITLGIQRIEPILYRLPAMIITDIIKDEGTFGGATLQLAEPSEVVNGRPYESDIVIPTFAGDLPNLVSISCTAALSRPTSVAGVPAIVIPAGTVAEFGSARWDICVRTADDLGVALRFTDAGDVVGTLRSAPLPSPVAEIQQAVLPGGSCHHSRIPTGSQVLVTRGNGLPGLIGTATTAAVTGQPMPAWYRPYIVSDRHEGGPATTQAQANQLAVDFLKVRLTDLETFVDLAIAPAPWLEAGVDVVTFAGRKYHVRAVRLDVPSLLTTVTLRRVNE